MYEFLADNIVYPKKAQRKYIQGKVYVQFIVYKDGQVGNVVVVKGTHRLIDKEAVRELKKCQTGNQASKEERK